MSRYYHTFPHQYKRKPDYSKLFNGEDKAKMEYNRNMDFRSFVQNWNTDMPELLAWSLLDFYKAYKNNGFQLTLALNLQ
jgi:hypothetical protein